MNAKSAVPTPSRDGFETEYPFPSHFINLGGHQYHYVDEGEGETLLMVHGNPTWSFAFRNFVKYLSHDYRVLAVDHIGCGFSDKPQKYRYCLEKHTDNLCQFIEQLGLKRLTLFGHDWGGAIGMGAAVRHPKRFARFVFFNTSVFRSEQIPRRIAMCRWPVFGPFAVRGLNLFAKQALRLAVENREHMTSSVRAGYLAPYDSWKHRIAIMRFIQDIPLGSGHPSYWPLTQLERGLKTFRKSPMLLVWGEKDWCFTIDFLEEMQKRFPRAETVRIRGAGHYVFEDAFRSILPRVQEFLKAHPFKRKAK